jgi:hypothetical protein
MIPAIVIGVLVLWVLIRACRRWGFKAVMEFACLAFLAIPAFAFVGLLLFSGVKAPSMTTGILVSLIAGVAACVIARKFGWGNLLGWIFSTATVVCGVVLVAFITLVTFMALNASGAGGH